MASKTETETIRERLVREEREAQEKRMAELRAEREARERAEAEAKARREAEAKAQAERAAEQARLDAERAAVDAEARRERNAQERKRVTAQLENQYVLFERSLAALGELIAAEEKGELTFHIPFRTEMEKAARQVRSNLDDTRNRLLNLEREFRTRKIAD